MQVISFQEFLKEILTAKKNSFHHGVQMFTMKGTANSTKYKDILENWKIPTSTAWGKLFCSSMSVPLCTKPAP